MKAYIITDLQGYADYSTVVFAETSGKAKAIAIHTDAFEDYEFTEISARRVPKLDKYYFGRKEMDWFNPSDRVALVREANFCCSYEMDIEDLGCEKCPAEQWCDRCVDKEWNEHCEAEAILDSCYNHWFWGDQS